MPAKSKKASLPDSSRSAPKDTPSSAPSRKRKMNSDGQTEAKFYAVRAGKKPGIYTVWKDCEAQITGFRGAAFKKFGTREEAQAFVEGRDPPSTNKPPRFYGVAVGRNPGVYTDWTEVQEQIRDVKGPKQKKFDTYAEAEEFVRTWRNTGAAVVTSSTTAVATGKTASEDVDEPPAKKAKKSTKSTKTNTASGEVILAYTDGSSRGNGRAGACAGLGVYFPHDPSWNISERLPGTPQTNQRAELAAILRCLQTVPKDTRVEIFSDSDYSIKCVTEWPIGWEKNQWKNDTVKNQDLIKEILALIKERDEGFDNTRTQFTWVKGHSGHDGNDQADELAVRGSYLPLPKDD
ncbi:ribonuclease H-like domain-containing protein [Cercophora newfieldiana]|uniref:Ribonuclease H n=1 Tax=Cercophora newfieldiana TaxID=92897 RepID=A0AA39XVW6_9PEZI|nr:ribonuclease H-like domain-containing protein [Cercophora newfieldiana]